MWWEMGNHMKEFWIESVGEGGTWWKLLNSPHVIFLLLFMANFPIFPIYPAPLPDRHFLSPLGSVLFQHKILSFRKSLISVAPKGRYHSPPFSGHCFCFSSFLPPSLVLPPRAGAGGREGSLILEQRQLLGHLQKREQWPCQVGCRRWARSNWGCLEFLDF